MRSSEMPGAGEIVTRHSVRHISVAVVLVMLAVSLGAAWAVKVERTKIRKQSC